MTKIKTLSLFSNFSPFGIYLLVNSIVDGLHYGFVISFSILVGLQILSILLLKRCIKKTIKKYSCSENKYRIVRITRDRMSSLNFVITNIFPLIAFSFNDIGSMVFAGMTILIIAILFYKNNLYIYNPFLEIVGFKIYNIEIEKLQDDANIETIYKITNKTNEIEEKETTNVVSRTLITHNPVALNKELQLKEFPDDIAYED